MTHTRPAVVELPPFGAELGQVAATPLTDSLEKVFIDAGAPDPRITAEHLTPAFELPDAMAHRYGVEAEPHMGALLDAVEEAPPLARPELLVGLLAVRGNQLVPTEREHDKLITPLLTKLAKAESFPTDPRAEELSRAVLKARIVRQAAGMVDDARGWDEYAQPRPGEVTSQQLRPILQAISNGFRRSATGETIKSADEALAVFVDMDDAALAGFLENRLDSNRYNFETRRKHCKSVQHAAAYLDSRSAIARQEVEEYLWAHYDQHLAKGVHGDDPLQWRRFMKRPGPHDMNATPLAGITPTALAQESADELFASIFRESRSQVSVGEVKWVTAKLHVKLQRVAWHLLNKATPLIDRK